MDPQKMNKRCHRFIFRHFLMSILATILNRTVLISILQSNTQKICTEIKSSFVSGFWTSVPRFSVTMMFGIERDTSCYHSVQTVNNSTLLNIFLWFISTLGKFYTVPTSGGWTPFEHCHANGYYGFPGAWFACWSYINSTQLCITFEFIFFLNDSEHFFK